MLQPSLDHLPVLILRPLRYVVNLWRDSSKRLSLATSFLLIIFIIASLVVRIARLHLETSLWLDESMLAESVVGKTTIQMLTPPLVNMQTAPLLYLFTVKVFTFIFGTSEWVLRLYSFLSLVFLLVVQGLVLRKVFNVRLVITLFSIALSSTFYFFLQYSVEFKPYMGDAFFSVLVLLLYFQYRRHLINALMLGLIYAVCLLYSTPSAFFIAGILIADFSVALLKHHRSRMTSIVFVGSIVLIGFIANYWLWLRPIASDSGMIAFWGGQRLNFHIWHASALVHDGQIISTMLSPLGLVTYPLIVLSVLGIIITIWQRNMYSLAVLVSFAVATIASILGMYPIQDRLWIFTFVWIFIYTSICLCWFWTRTLSLHHVPRIILRWIATLIACGLIAPNYAFTDYGIGAQWTLRPGNQVNPLISYVDDHIQPGEVLFSYRTATPTLKFKIGYHTNVIGDSRIDNIIWGLDSPLHYGDDEMLMDIDRIVSSDAAYILFNHAYFLFSHDAFIGEMIKRLSNAGYMDLVMDVNHTPLYWFTTDRTKVKSAIAYGETHIVTQNEAVTGTFVVTNTGSTILRSTGYGALNFVFSKADGSQLPIETIQIDEDLNPGESATITINASGLQPGVYKLDALCLDEYVFSDLGVDPLTLTISS